jgi:hypothetical protein
MIHCLEAELYSNVVKNQHSSLPVLVQFPVCRSSTQNFGETPENVREANLNEAAAAADAFACG